MRKRPAVDRAPEVGIPESPYMTAEETARYMRCPNVRAFYEWRKTHPLPECRRGRQLLFDRRVVDAFLRGELWTKRRSA